MLHNSETCDVSDNGGKRRSPRYSWPSKNHDRIEQHIQNTAVIMPIMDSRVAPSETKQAAHCHLQALERRSEKHHKQIGFE
jgi:hypothetical protein